MSEIPERFLSEAFENKAEDLLADLLVGEGDIDGLCDEIKRMLFSQEKADRDALEDLTIRDIATRVCEKIAEQMMDDGDLDEAAMDLAIGASERYSEGTER